MVHEENATEAMHQPSAEKRPVEAIISRNMVKRAIWVAPILILVFGITGGVAGAVAAGIGVAIVVVNFLIGGWILSTAAGVSLTLYHAAALFGFFIRLGLITLTMLLVASVTDIANNWGFWHLGDFARNYRREFDELPSETLGGTGRTQY